MDIHVKNNKGHKRFSYCIDVLIHSYDPKWACDPFIGNMNILSTKRACPETDVRTDKDLQGHPGSTPFHTWEN